jgi:hypothetical protein
MRGDDHQHGEGRKKIGHPVASKRRRSSKHCKSRRSVREKAKKQD